MFQWIKRHALWLSCWVLTALSVGVIALTAPAYAVAAATADTNEKNQSSYQKQPTQKSILSLLPFQDKAFQFQCLWRFGNIASGGGDFGEMLTAARGVKDNDHDSWHSPWFSMAEQTAAAASKYMRNGNVVSAQAAFFRATGYYRTSEIYLPANDPRVVTTWKKGRDCFLKAAELSDGLIKFMEIPFEDTTLPAYWIRVDNSGRKRPLLIIQTGLDGTAEDLYFIIAHDARKRGYNCLIFEGPGQGEMIRVKNKPFRFNWETVVTPVVDFALKLPEVEESRTAMIGYSMGGYLVPRAMAFEHRIKYTIVDSGVFSVFDGLMTKFPAEVKADIDKDTAEKKINRIVSEEQKNRPDIDQFIKQMLWTFNADSPFQLFRKLKQYSMQDSIEKIRCDMLIVNSVNDQVAGSFAQSKKFYSALKSPKTYLEFSDAEGGQFHCQIGAPSVSAERILNWLDDRFAGSGR